MLARVFLAAMASAAIWPANAYALNVVARGESAQAAIVETVAPGFTAATDIPLRVDTWDGGLETLKGRAAEGAWDLVQVEPDELAMGCADGSFEKLDWPAIGGKEHYAAMGISDCGVGAAVNNLVLAWDRDKFPAVPTWADFWDVAKIPGKRGLAKSVKGALEFALLADGVAVADVYKTLGTAEGIDRAFRKLDQLKPYIVWWQTAADATKILGSGDVLMTATPSGAIAAAARGEKRNFGAQFAGSLYEPRYWAAIKGTPNLREATQFLYLTGAPSVQIRMFRSNGEIGLARGVNDWLTPDQQALSPTFQGNLTVALRVDNAFWRENLAKLRVRFEAWLAQ